MKLKVVMSTLLLFLLFLSSASVALQVSATITGNAPPASGDWVITQPTVVSGENITIDGNIIVKSKLVVEDSTIWLKQVNAVFNVTEQGSIILKNSTVRGYDQSIRWEFRVYNGANCSIDKSVIMGAGHSGLDTQSGIWINTPNVIINNSLIMDAYVGVL